MATHIVVEEIDAEERTAVISGRKVLRGVTLEALVQEIGGYEGELTQPSTGRRFPVSLEPWRERDPSSTWLVVTFHTEPPEVSPDVMAEAGRRLAEEGSNDASY